MSKRRGAESDVVRFFMAAEPNQAVLVYRMVRSILEHRGVFGQATAATPRPVRRVPRKTTEPPGEAAS